MSTSGQVRWLQDFVVPAYYTFFGAVLGFAASQVKDFIDSRRYRKSFLKAIRVELTTLHQHLAGTLTDVTEVINVMKAGEKKALHLSTTFQTGVYNSQLGKLRDVSDPLILEVIRLYDQLSNLERVKAHVAKRAFELAALTNSGTDLEHENPIASDYESSLKEVQKRISKLIPDTDNLISKLPQ